MRYQERKDAGLKTKDRRTPPNKNQKKEVTKMAQFFTIMGIFALVMLGVKTIKG